MSAPRIVTAVIVAFAGIMVYVLWPRTPQPDPPANPDAGPYMLHVRAMEARPAAGLLGGALGAAAMDGPAEPWWAGVGPRASAETRP